MFRLLIGLLVNVWIARHLGPSSFGQLSFALSFASLFGIIATLGLNRILVRELVANAPDHQLITKLMSTALAMRLIAAIVMFLICMVSAWLMGEGSLLLIGFIASGFFFNASDCIELYFQSKVQAKATARARLLSFSLVTLLRVALLLSSAGVEAFAAVTLIEYCAAACALQLIYRHHGLRFAHKLVDWPLARNLLRESWPEILAGFSCLLFMRLDQIMLQHLIGPKEVGTFAVAARLSEIWYFIPIAIISSTFPNIVEKKHTSHETYMRRIQLLMTGLVGLSYFAALGAIFLGKPIIKLLYGPAYRESAEILIIHIWSGVFVVLGLSSGSWIMAEKKAKLNLYRNLAGVAANIFLNFLLIPTHGAIGAAYATLFSIITAYLLFDLMAPSMREICQMKWRALLLSGWR